MKDLEKAIEEAADTFCSQRNTIAKLDDLDGPYCYEGFIIGAKSPAAKAYWFEQFNKDKSNTEKRLDAFIKSKI